MSPHTARPARIARLLPATGLAAIAVIAAIAAIAVTLVPTTVDAAEGCILVSAPAEPPLVIDQPGSYCLSEDIEVFVAQEGVQQQGIVLEGDDISLDLRGHEVRNVGPVSRSTTGVRMSGDGIALTNGRIVGFMWGVLASCEGSGQRIADLHVDRSTLQGISIGCDGSLVEGNLITDTDGDVFDIEAAVEVYGAANRVVDNDIIGVGGVGGPGNVGIGIEFSGLGAGLAIDNRISRTDVGVSAGYGAPPAKAPLCRGNVTADVGTPYRYCVDMGRND